MSLHDEKKLWQFPKTYYKTNVIFLTETRIKSYFSDSEIKTLNVSGKTNFLVTYNKTQT